MSDGMKKQMRKAEEKERRASAVKGDAMTAEEVERLAKLSLLQVKSKSSKAARMMGDERVASSKAAKMMGGGMSDGMKKQMRKAEDKERRASAKKGDKMTTEEVERLASMTLPSNAASSKAARMMGGTGLSFIHSTNALLSYLGFQF